ncbi:MAG: GyrI-like domain-containing protein [Bacteroidetes Order II. Incertae sedis bacterium]|nr:GyrI-like domain-containing protein [Bacteroidetes Order II. bacterium]
MEKLDLTKQYKSYYSAKPMPELVNIGPARYVVIEGKGDPSGEAFATDLEALFPVAYAIKFYFNVLGQDFIVPKLEGQWWFDMEKFGMPDLASAPAKVPRSEWSYRLLLRMPHYVTESGVEKAIEEVVSKKKKLHAANVRFYEMTEGPSVQILHLGAFADEPASLQKLHQFMEENNFTHNGLHHEIYLSDFRKTPEHRLKTILREPIKLLV